MGRRVIWWIALAALACGGEDGNSLPECTYEAQGCQPYECVLETGNYTLAFRAADVETVAQCRSEFRAPATFPQTGSWLALRGDGCTTSSDGCSMACPEASTDEGTYEYGLGWRSTTSAEGYATYYFDDGRVCSYDVALERL